MESTLSGTTSSLVQPSVKPSVPAIPGMMARATLTLISLARDRTYLSLGLINLSAYNTTQPLAMPCSNPPSRLPWRPSRPARPPPFRSFPCRLPPLLPQRPAPSPRASPRPSPVRLRRSPAPSRPPAPPSGGCRCPDRPLETGDTRTGQTLAINPLAGVELAD